MKKILVGLVACAMIFTMSTSAFAAKAYIPFWQNGGNVTTLISVVANDGTGAGGTFVSTTATITVTLMAADTSSNYTISPTTASGAATGTTGQTFATATFKSVAGGVMLVDTAQISGSTAATVVWTTGDAYGAGTSAKFGYGTITGSSNDHRAYVAVYGGTNPAGFSVDIAGGGTF